MLTLGITADIHYHHCPLHEDGDQSGWLEENLRPALEAFESAGVDAHVSLGDLYEDFDPQWCGGDVAAQNIQPLEAMLDEFQTYPHLLVGGNHDVVGAAGESRQEVRDRILDISRYFVGDREGFHSAVTVNGVRLLLVDNTASTASEDGFFEANLDSGHPTIIMQHYLTAGTYSLAHDALDSWERFANRPGVLAYFQGHAHVPFFFVEQTTGARFYTFARNHPPEKGYAIARVYGDGGIDVEGFEGQPDWGRR